MIKDDDRKIIEYIKKTFKGRKGDVIIMVGEIKLVC